MSSTPIEAFAETVGEAQGSANNMWMLIAGVLVFFMHAGFTMLEAGSVKHTSAVNILFKNIGTISIGVVLYYFFGYSFAYGTGNDDSKVEEGFTLMKFIGTGAYALDGIDASGMAFAFFQAMFAATAATIVSGAVAGRIALPAYFALAAWLTGFVYPVVTHLTWSTGGWLSAFNSGCNEGPDAYCATYKQAEGGVGLIDFAGSGIVHMTGGVAAFWACLLVGPRIGRFASPSEFAPHSIWMQALGVFILWFGWYGFNCGSTLTWSGSDAGSVAVTTTLAPSAAVVTAIIITRAVYGHFEVSQVLNAALAGLVSITAGCGNLTDGMAIVTGAIGACVYLGSSKLLKVVKIDDPVDAIPVHGFCGAWGVIAAGLFNAEGSTAVIMETQLLSIGVIAAWTSAMMIPPLLALKFTGRLRVSEEDEKAGLDESEHAAKAFLGADNEIY